MKHPLLLLAFMLAGSCVMAQNRYFGIKGGLNIAHVTISFGGLSASSNDLTSFHAGFYGVLMTSEKFGFQPELMYSAQGGGSSGGSGDFKLNYLSVPILMRYTFTPGVNIQAGPQVGFLMSATVDGMDAKSAMSDVDFGLCFGLGVERPSGVSFSFRYALGLSNTFNSTTSSAFNQLGFSNTTMTNRVIQLSLGFRLGKKA